MGYTIERGVYSETWCDGRRRRRGCSGGLVKILTCRTRTLENASRNVLQQQQGEPLRPAKTNVRQSRRASEHVIR